MKFFKKKFKDFFKIFQEYSKNISPKAATIVIKKQENVARVILFAPRMNIKSNSIMSKMIDILQYVVLKNLWV